VSESSWIRPEWRSHPEFQSALVRLGLWLFGAAYIGLGAWTGYYRVDVSYYLTLFFGYLAVFVALAVDVALHPTRRFRRYLALTLDVSAVSLAIFLTREAISPFFLIYIWIFISYGTRFGKRYLVVASVLSVVAYNLVLVELSEWQRHTFEAFFFLLLLVVLPLYQFALLRRVQQARLEAERANQAKGHFLSTMTHELRTPLSGVIGMTQLLEGTQMTPEQREYVRSISSSAHLLRALIGDVLDLSKIEARKVQIEHLPFRPRPVVLEVCNALQSQALDKGLELVCAIDGRVPDEVVGDQLRVRQILFNLLGNAIKFTERGQVVVRCRVAEGDRELPRSHLLLEIEDSGIGIAADKLPRIFDSFWQADDSTTRRYGGSGLGTTIARDLTQLMGGVIGVASVEGEGSRFSVKLPLLPEGFTPVEPAYPAVLRGRQMLLFEANGASRDAILGACAEMGIHCRAVDSVDGLARITGSGPPIDLAMVADSPRGEDLDTVLGQISRGLRADIPFVLLTYSSRRPDVDRSCVRCLNKPFSPEQLAGVLARVLTGAREHRGSAGGADAPSRSAPPRGAGGLRILVAEDNAIAAKVITTLLQREGYATTLVRDGEEALRKAAEEAFDLAFVDLRMPKLDGLEFTRRHRSTETPERRLPIVALTANAAEDVRQGSLAAGMDGFLVKPVEPEELSAAVRRFVRPGKTA